MSTIDTISRELAAGVADQGDFDFDPALILVIVQIVIEIIEQLDECNDEQHAERIKQIQRRRPLIAMWRLKRIVRSHIGNDEPQLEKRICDGLMKIDEGSVRQAIEEVLV